MCIRILVATKYNDKRNQKYQTQMRPFGQRKLTIPQHQFRPETEVKTDTNTASFYKINLKQIFTTLFTHFHKFHLI